MKNAIVVVFDDNYFNYFQSLYRSLKLNYRNHPEILAIYDGSSQEVLEYLDATENLRHFRWSSDYFEKIGLSLKTLNLGLVNKINVFYKYIVWTDLFDCYDNVLYLDVDTLVLTPLDSIFLETEFFIVSDFNTSRDYRLFYPRYSCSPDLLEKLKQDGLHFLDGNHDMANAGVFLIPKKYRTRTYLKQLINITYRYNIYLMFADQSAISLWCHVNRLEIRKNLKFNFQINFYLKELENFLYEEICIVHFSWCKPKTNPFKSIEDRFKHFSKVLLQLPI